MQCVRFTLSHRFYWDVASLAPSQARLRRIEGTISQDVLSGRFSNWWNMWARLYRRIDSMFASQLITLIVLNWNDQLKISPEWNVKINLLLLSQCMIVPLPAKWKIPPRRRISHTEKNDNYSKMFCDFRLMNWASWLAGFPQPSHSWNARKPNLYRWLWKWP